MHRVTRRRLMGSLLAIGAMVVLAAAIPGCAPPPEQSTGTVPEAASPQTTAGIEAPAPPTVEFPATPPATEPPAGPGTTGAGHELPPAQPPAEPPKSETHELPHAEAPKPQTPALVPPATEKPAEPAPKPEEKPAAAIPPAESKPVAEPKPEGAAVKPAPGAADVKISIYAPAEDLVAQLDEYVEEIEDAVKSESEFAENKEAVARDAHTLIPIALALGLHDTDNKYKQAGPAIYQAAQKLAAAKDYAEAKAATDEVKKALGAKGDPAGLKWEDAKVASLQALMKEVPLIYTKLRSNARTESRVKKGADKVAGYAAAIATIGQGSLPSAGQTQKPDEVDQWQAYCLQMRDAAADLNSKVRAFAKGGSKQEFEAIGAALKVLNPTSCEACHVVFAPDQAGKTTE